MSMNHTSSGYLIVLEAPEFRGENGRRLNPQYAGLDRVPTYPSKYAEEAFAIDEYVFGGVKCDETNVIPDFGAALKLWGKFSSSPRTFAIILCCSGPDDVMLTGFKLDDVVALGYDVAALKGDCWSIVGDPTAADWAKLLLSRLNEYGLFRDRADAQEYLRGCIEHGEPDVAADSGFEAVYVVQVSPFSARDKCTP